MILHHPPEELLLALAAGRLSAGQDLVVAAHAERCAECASQLHMFASLGGAVLELTDPHPLADDAWSATLERLSNESEQTRSLAPAQWPPTDWLPQGCTWPASLRGCTFTPWRSMGPGKRFCRVQLPYAREGSLFLLSIAPGGTFPRHGHEQMELTQVLCGAFADHRALFGPGDFDVAGPEVRHEPIVQAGSVCVCLTWVEGRLHFDSGIAASMAHCMGV